jgi:hypothetical protein
VPERFQYDTRTAGNVAKRPLQLIGPDKQRAKTSNFLEKHANVGRVEVAILNFSELLLGQWLFERHS